MARTALIVWLATGMLAAACGNEPEAPIDRQTFEDVMVELRKAVEDADSAAFAERRREILESAGVTDSALLAFVRIHEVDLEYMAEVWESIDARVNELDADESDTLTVQ